MGSNYERYTIEDHDSANNATVLDITGHKNQISDFVKALNGDTTVEICDQYEGIKAVKIIEKIYKCSKEKKEGQYGKDCFAC